MKKYALFLFWLSLKAFVFADAYIGKGCTTAWWIDEDCDGFVVGAKNPIVRGSQIAIPIPPNMEPDVNDNDPALNTTASFLARYGPSAQGFKNYLNDLGYTHPIDEIFFISPTGDDITAQPNNVALPYRNRPTPQCNSGCCSGPCLEPRIREGDVVVYRGGTYPEGLSTLGSGYPRFDALQGTAQLPILLINYPGERAIFQTANGGFSFARNSAYVTAHGFEFEGQYLPNQFSRQVVNLDQPSEHCTIRYCEIRNGDRWGIFGPLIQGRNFLTLDHIVVHHIGMEHCLYRNNGAGLQEANEDTGWIIQDSLFYVSGGHGIHWRGGQHFTFQRNIIHSVSWFGVEMKNGCKYGTLDSNLIFNTGRGPIVMWSDGDPTLADDSGIKHMMFKHNIFWTKTGDNGFGNETHAAIRMDRHVAPRLYEDISFFNNIFNPVGAVPLEMYQLSLLPELHVESNIFYRTNPGAAGMMVCGETDGTHTSVNNDNARGICPGGTPAYYWTVEAMQDPINRPQFVNNIHANPLFADVSNNYAMSLSPGLFDFSSTVNSPSVDFAEPSHAANVDLRRNPRVGPADAGAYEYSAVSGNNPPSVDAGPDQTLPPGLLQTQLSANASDDGLPNPPGQLFLQWTKAAGPGQVAFNAATSQQTTVTFSQGGTYDLRFSATDGAIYRADLIRVVVGMPSSGGQAGSALSTEFVSCFSPNDPIQRANLPICFNLEKAGNFSLDIYSKNGIKVRRMFNENRAAGFHTLTWNGKNEVGENVPSGVYTMILSGETKARGKIPIIR